MRSIRIATALINQGESYLFQRRNAPGQLGALGLVGSYGGKIEPGETAVQTLIRELSEETSLNLDVSEVWPLNKFTVTSEVDGTPVKIIADGFMARIAETVTFESFEGDLVRLHASELPSSLGTMTPATRACVEYFLIEGVQHGRSS
jgi:8-oxo-dGTP pyrophosphatase MutT (NUDIX family)